jgi:hypothetical protein
MDRKPQINILLDKLNKQLSILEECSFFLEKNLSPTLTPLLPVPEGPPVADDILTPLAKKLYEISDRLYQVTKNIDSLNRRLDIDPFE